MQMYAKDRSSVLFWNVGKYLSHYAASPTRFGVAVTHQIYCREMLVSVTTRHTYLPWLKLFCDFPRRLQANVVVVPRLGQERFP
jgi:hypothetical protein